MISTCIRRRKEAIRHPSSESLDGILPTLESSWSSLMSYALLANSSGLEACQCRSGDICAMDPYQ